MRVCPLCNAEYEDSIEFCFNDGSPLDMGEDEKAASSLEQDLGFRADESAEFLPPEATGLTGEFEAVSAEAPLEDDDEFGDRDSGIEVVPGGLTSPLDDESVDELVTDPFSSPVAAVEPDALARPDVDEGAATLPAPPREDTAPPEAETLLPPDEGTDDELSLERTGDDGAEEVAPDPEKAPGAFESGAVAEALDDPPEASPPVDPDEDLIDDDPEMDDETGAAGEPGADDVSDHPEAEADDAAGARAAARAPESGADVPSESPEPPPAAAQDTPPEPPPAAPRGVTAQGPVSAKETYLDPLYASIPPGERGERRSKAIWVLGGILALLLVCVAGYFVVTQLSKRGPAAGPAVSADVDTSPEDRAPNPTNRRPPRDNGHADAATPGDAETADEEIPPPLDEEEITPPEDVTPPPDETEAERLRRERREDREREAREERRKAREEERERERAEREAAEAAGSTGTTGDPWSTGTPGTTTTAPDDPADPWSTGSPGNATGRLTITSTPGGASFSIDGQQRGVTPLTVDLTYGSHRLKVEKAGYKPQERQFEVAASKVLQDFTLVAAAEKGKLTVYTNPEPGATLYVDGVQRGKTPLTLEMSPGVHTLRVELAGFPTREETIDLSDLQPGEVRRRTIDLQ